MTLLYLVAAWAAGLFLASTGPETPSVYWIGLAAGSLVAAYIIRHNRPWRLGFICLAIFAFGAERYIWLCHPDRHHRPGC
jgi:MFS family permease